MNTFGLSTTLLRGGVQDAQTFDLIAQHRFQLLEIIESDTLNLRDGRTLDSLKTLLAGAGLSPGAVVGALADADHLIDAAAVLGSSLVVLRSYRCARVKQTGAAVDQALVRKNIDRLASRLEQASMDIDLAIDFPSWRGLTPDALRDFVDSFEDLPVGVVFDAGHAAMEFSGQAPEAAEALSGFLVSVRLHDNNGRDDVHRAPFAGSIDWAGLLTACWKTGFTGPWILDLAPDGDERAALDRAVGARTRLQAILEDLSQPFAFTE